MLNFTSMSLISQNILKSIVIFFKHTLQIPPSNTLQTTLKTCVKNTPSKTPLNLPPTCLK